MVPKLALDQLHETPVVKAAEKLEKLADELQQNIEDDIEKLMFMAVNTSSGESGDFQYRKEGSFFAPIFNKS